MKLNKYLKTSLAKQFSILTVTIILAFSLLISVFLFLQYQQLKEFEKANDRLDQKEKLASQLDYAFNLAVSEMRAYYAYKGEPSYFQKVMEQQKIVQEKINSLNELAENDEDRLFIRYAQDFYTYFFIVRMPKSKELFDSGQFDEVTKIAVSQNGSKTTRAYQSNLKKYSDQLSDEQSKNRKEQNEKIISSQLLFVVIFFILIGMMAFITRIILGRMGRPLRNLTNAAIEIAEGNTIVFTDTTNRQDELGLLSKAFEKMSKSIQEKEQHLSQLFQQSEGERLLTQNILDTINEGILLVDVKGKVIQVNQKMCDMMDCHSNSLLEKKFEDWVEELAGSVGNGMEVKRFFKGILLEGETDQPSFIYHQHRPLKRAVQVYCEGLTRDGEKIGTVIVHRDITKEYEVDVMKSEFVSTVSHELRTPLASVLGFTELMINKELKPERQKKYLTTIYQEAKRLTALINDFLDVQKMESGKQIYEKKVEDLIPILKCIMETYEVNLPHHRFVFDVETQNTSVFGDKDKLSQVFNNLFSNAIKYSPEGGKIEVRLFEEDSNVLVSIKDEGLGIPADAIEHLFTKFYRVDNSDRRKIGGTGLGLAIVKEIVKAHNGDITVKTALKEGSQFTVSLPQEAEVSGTTQDSILESAPIPDLSEKVHVVIVEDDITHANLLQTELEESNFQVKVFVSGEAALAAVIAAPPDVIVLDIILGENVMDGWEFIRRVKEQKELFTIPIFISSALDDKEKGKALGANEYLIKPYPPSKLSKSIFQTLLRKDRKGPILIPIEDEEEK